MKKIIKKQPLAILLAFLLIINPMVASFAYSEAEEPTPTEAEESSSQPADEAVAEETQGSTVTNENEANIDNNTDVEANTGDNTISSEPPPSADPTATPEALTDSEEVASPEPSLEPSPQPSVEPNSSPELILESPSPSPGGEEESVDSDLDPLQLTEEVPIEGAVENGSVSGNQNSNNNNDESNALALDGEEVVVNNENQATIQNDLATEGITGENETIGDSSQATTGDAEAQINATNVVNTNVVGVDFWQVIINQYEDSQGDLDLSSIEGLENLNTGFITALAANLQTGDDSTNLALATLLCLLAVYNDNQATLTNNLNLLASSGSNQLVGDANSLQTGDASALLNLFNMVNTNLIGSDWFFGVINLFGELQGDIILPNEWLFLGEGGSADGSSVMAANLDTGEDSNNQALAGSNTSLNISNNNEADLTNNVSVLANSGDNTIIGEGSIETGNANADLNLFNIVNTNIVGSRWVLLVINNMGEWVGNVLNWWGSLFTIGNTTLAWVQLPVIGDGQSTDIMALNSETGEDSANQTIALNQNTTTIENHNVATVENNISVTADTGNNLIQGSGAEMQTGNASAIANIFNFLNTNIIGNHWYFCMINIFDRLVGNIRFYREPVDEETEEETSPTEASANSSSGGDTNDSGCHDQAPGGAPKLLSAVAGENSVTLTWEKAPDPVSYYLVAYGEESGIYLYGNPNLGGPETTSYTINHLSGGKTYYFVVRAGNGCAPGPFSNELAATPYGTTLAGAAENFLPGVLGVQAAEGELGGGLTDEGMSSRIIPWWLIFSLSGTSLLAALSRGFYLLFRKS